MALGYTGTDGWVLENLATNYETGLKTNYGMNDVDPTQPRNRNLTFKDIAVQQAGNGIYEYDAEDFYNPANLLKANRPDSGVIYVKVENGRGVNISYYRRQGDWRPIYLYANEFFGRNRSGYSGYGLQVLASNAGFTWKENARQSAISAAKNIENNYQRNIADERANERTIRNAEKSATRANIALDNKAKGLANKINTNNSNINKDNKALNNSNKLINDWSKQVKTKSQNTEAGTWLTSRDSFANFNSNELNKLKGIKDSRGQSIYSNAEINTFKKAGTTTFRSFYGDKKITFWNAKTQGAQPPTGGFKSSYYITEYGDVGGASSFNQRWKDAVDNDDIDITLTYGGKDNYAHWDYTTNGISNGYRGNAAQNTETSDRYEENFFEQKDKQGKVTVVGLTDAEREYIRDGQLGLTEKEEGTLGLRGINFDDPEGALEGGVVDLVFQDYTEKRIAEEEKFGALVEFSLKESIKVLDEQREQERELDIYKGLPGFNEVFNVNESITNSLLGDSGIGGYLGMMGVNTDQYKENLTDALSGATGVNFGGAAYNWQKWLDEDLTKKINELEEVKGLTTEEIYELTDEFKQVFIDEYITPRFDNSKSMNEFISYMDTLDDDEQNLLQTQSAVNAIQQVAEQKAAQFYSDLVKGQGTFSTYDGGFNSAFYFDPLADIGSKVNPAKEELYTKQKEIVAADWEQARTNGNAKPQVFNTETGQYEDSIYTWDQWAYFYGVNKENPQEFAKLHYDVVGSGRNFDPARDIVTKGDVDDYIQGTVIPAVEDAEFEVGDKPFVDFVTAEEFADSMLEGVNPLENKDAWAELLEEIGYDYTDSIEEVREYFIEAFQTEAAKDIREGIKYYNEKKLKPTQDKLGVSYIEREEDFKDIEPDVKDSLYTVFKDAGYAGNIDEFYDEFMPDADRSDIDFLNRYMQGDLKLKEIDDDPFAALAQVGSFFGGGEDEDIFGQKKDEDEDDDDDDDERSYFTLFEEDDAAFSGKKGDGDFVNEYLGLFG